MKILGIESTAHTIGIGIINNDLETLANQKDMYEPEKGGIHPRKASEHHYSKFQEVLNNALNEANTEMSDIDCVAFSQGPGIPQCLQVGAVAARSLALKHEIPLTGVNHCIAHITIGKNTTKAENPITLYLSGGNSQIITQNNEKYTVIGETQDIAIGNALDKLARKLGYPHPGGPEIEKLAEKTNEIIELSYPIKGMDFSFSGIVTETQRKIGEISDEVLANSFQEHSYAVTVEALERALSQENKEEALLTGGVAMNKRLREMIKQMCEQRNAEFYVPDPEYCMDNGVMIAQQGLKQIENNKKLEIPNSEIKPNWRPDEV